MEALEYVLGFIPDIFRLIISLARLFGISLPLFPSGE